MSLPVLVQLKSKLFIAMIVTVRFLNCQTVYIWTLQHLFVPSSHNNEFYYSISLQLIQGRMLKNYGSSFSQLPLSKLTINACEIQGFHLFLRGSLYVTAPQIAIYFGQN